MAQSNLHFSLFKTWGHRKLHLTPSKEDATSASPAVWDTSPISTPSDMGKPSPPLEDGLERIWKKLMAADKSNLTEPQQPRETNGDDGRADTIPETRPTTRKIRQRRRRTDFPPRVSSPSPPQTQTRSLRSRSVARSEKEQRRDKKFSVSLSREEVDEDFYALTGRRASGRPKRRPPSLRKHLNLLFPGQGLSEITAACYEVASPRL